MGRVVLMRRRCSRILWVLCPNGSIMLRLCSGCLTTTAFCRCIPSKSRRRRKFIHNFIRIYKRFYFLVKRNLLGSSTLVKRRPKEISWKRLPEKQLGMFVGREYRQQHQQQLRHLWRETRKILSITFARRSSRPLLLLNLLRGTGLLKGRHATQRIFSVPGSPSLCLVRLTPAI